jgi:DDE family transposase
MRFRESRYVRVARLAHALTLKTLPRYSHAKSPHHFTLPQLAACVLLMFYLDLSYRDMEEWLLATDAVIGILGLPRIPDHTTLQRTLKKLRLLDFDNLQTQLLAPLQVEEEAIAVDSTGFTPDQASAYFQARSGRQIREYVKGAYAVGTQSQMILGWRAGSAHTHDVTLLPSLRRQAARYGHRQKGRCAWLLLGDMGFDGNTIRSGDLIPPIRRNGKLRSAERQARADLVAAARLDGVYGQRWKSETAHSVIKRKFGETIRSRLRRLQHREPIVKGLIYNLHVCVRALA